MAKFLVTSKGSQGKRDQGKEPNPQHKVSFALADFVCGGSTCLEQIGNSSYFCIAQPRENVEPKVKEQT
jgi:hypothetical protein